MTEEVIRIVKKSIFINLLFLFAVLNPLTAEGRAALVIGNGAYTGVPSLANPPNDAEDMAKTLKEAGFEVVLLINADLAEMEAGLDTFTTLLKGKDTALFYYAGHGVQVAGENYLIPVKETIENEAQVKSRGVALGDVLDRVKISGVKTALMFLDACRNNPFPGSSRSGTRGLSVVATPRDIESLIAFATEPGYTAEDGDGRNGIFTAALLKCMKEPGINITDMMAKVRSEVMEETKNQQAPNSVLRLNKPFFFIDAAALAEKAQAASMQAAADLAALEKQIADQQVQIDAEKNKSKKSALEVEQQKQQALQAAKKLEAENLAKEAERQKLAADNARQIALQKQSADQAAIQKQGELAALAATRRAELEKLAQNGASENPDVLIETVERLEVALKEVDGQYAEALKKSLDATNATWDKKLAVISSQTADITESDDEFAARINKEKVALETKRSDEITKITTETESQRKSQTATIRKQFDDTLKTLQKKVWTISGSDTALTIGEYDRNAKTWPFTVESTDKMIPMYPITVTAQLAKTADPVASIKSLDAAVKANALSAEIDWGITREANDKRYGLDIRSVRVRNLTSNQVVAEQRPNQRVANFQAGHRATPAQTWGTLVINTDTADVFLNDRKVGIAPLSLYLTERTVKIELRWTGNYKPCIQEVPVAIGQSTTISMSIPKIGDRGPAGGIIFYDQGSESGGWRYLEAAPADLNAMQWGEENTKVFNTGMRIGTGKTNTALIIAAQGGGFGSYAANACAEYQAGNENDWFLPSVDELQQIMQNRKVIGNINERGCYWSSSVFISGEAFTYKVQGQSQGVNMRTNNLVRPVRACLAKQIQITVPPVVEQKDTANADSRIGDRLVVGSVFKGTYSGGSSDVTFTVTEAKNLPEGKISVKAKAECLLNHKTPGSFTLKGTLDTEGKMMRLEKDAKIKMPRATVMIGFTGSLSTEAQGKIVWSGTIIEYPDVSFSVTEQ